MKGIKAVVCVTTIIIACSVAGWAGDPKQDILKRLEHIKINREVKETPEVTRSLAGSKVFNMVAKSVVIVVTDKAKGSGVIVTETGVVTNWHVVEDADEYIVVVLLPKTGTLTKDDMYLAEIIKRLPQKDLAALKIVDPPEDLVIAPLADFSSLQVGQDVHAIGHPESLYWTYTPGVISQIRWNFKIEDFRGTVIQTQAVISFGSSGGALFNDFGQLVGITTFITDPGLNFAVASNEILSLFN